MNSDKSLNDRRQALEASFFAKRSEAEPASGPPNTSTEEQRTALASASGIRDGAILDHLLAANIRADTIAAIGMVPLLAVAWADGRLSDDERRGVLSACESEGIFVGSEGARLLDNWLQEHPSDELLLAWREFITAAKKELSLEALTALQEDILSRAKKLALSSGQLGSSAASTAEQRVLDLLRQAFEPS